ncbi:thioesterase-like superfamily-domain-containing protein [Podospora aff. communis PSN243]|uniref:Thioesterase-like superfamily-domain-containing protein n=1 Tax=Podospora aff. communis PSN243 TaxID=3040156 RepID=A0AAV9GIZ1_9PEZI|nr:thioesterase-like superfamily-domain-containing protein [Podospora aff. communis PSN243]
MPHLRPISAQSALSVLRPSVTLRPFSSIPAHISTSISSPTDLPPPPPPRWIADLRSRIGKCIIFGCSNSQVSRASVVLRALALEWRELLAGSEGFLTGGRRGLDSQRVAWGEMDSFQHVNNVNYYRYAESARVNWITNFAVHVDPSHRDEWRDLMSPKATGLIMRSLKADFKFPMTYPDKISVFHKLRSLPQGDPLPSNFMLDCIVLSHQHRRIAARLEEDIVVYDYKAARKTSMPDFMAALFAETYRLQEAETLRARTRIWDLISAVEALEKETWDRVDAVEDVGSAKGSA